MRQTIEYRCNLRYYFNTERREEIKVQKVKGKKEGGEE
jgi:hypothetical protein